MVLYSFTNNSKMGIGYPTSKNPFFTGPRRAMLALTGGTYAANRLYAMPQRQYRSGQSRTLTSFKRGGRGTGSFKRKVMKLHPAKHYTIDSAPTNVHNTLLTCVPTQGITQGDGNTSRDGDAIHIESLKVKGTMLSNTIAGAYQHRFIVGWSGEELTTANIATAFVSGLASTELFLPTTSTNWLVDGIINPKAFTVLYDETYDINSQVSGAGDLMGFSATIPIHQDFVYQSSGSVMGKTKNLCMIVLGGVAGGTTGTTSIGQHLISADLIFKNA